MSNFGDNKLPQDIGRPSSSSGKAREASHDFSSNPLLYSTPETQRQEHQMLQQAANHVRQFEHNRRHGLEQFKHDIHQQQLEGLGQFEREKRQELEQFEHNTRKELLERLDPQILQLDSKQLELYMRHQMEKMQKQPLPERQIQQDAGEGPSMPRDSRAAADSSRDVEGTRDQIAIDKKSEAELHENIRMALCPQIKSGIKSSREDSSLRQTFAFARVAAEGKLERLNLNYNTGFVDKNTRNQKANVYEDIIRVVSFAMEGTVDTELKASMRRLSTHKEAPNKPNRSIEHVIDRINDPQVKEYWNSQYDQAEHS